MPAGATLRLPLLRIRSAPAIDRFMMDELQHEDRPNPSGRGRETMRKIAEGIEEDPPLYPFPLPTRKALDHYFPR